MPARQPIVAASFFLLLTLFSVLTHDAARAQERWPPWQSYTEAEEAARQKALKRKAAAANNPANIKRQVEQLKGAGKFAQAVPLAQRLLSIAERKGPQSLEVADALDTLAGLYEAQSKFADAEPLLKRSLAIREKAPGQPGLVATRERLAVAYDNLGKADDAKSVRSAAAPAAVRQESERDAAAQADADGDGVTEQQSAEFNGRGAVKKKVEEPFLIPPADAPGTGHQSAQAEAEAPAPEAGQEEPFRIPSADTPAGGAAPPAAEAEAAPKPAEQESVELPEAKSGLPEFGARRMVMPRDGAPRATAPPPVAAAPAAPAPSPEVPEPEDSREHRTDIIAEPMPGAAEDAPAAADDAPGAAPPPPVAEASPPPLEGGGGTIEPQDGYHDGLGAGPSVGAAAPPPPPPPAPPAAAAAPPAPAPSAAPEPPPARVTVEPSGGAGPPQSPDWQLVPVYWGTDRAVQPNAQRLAFGSDRARKLQLGMAQITVPKVHAVPNVERPWVVKIPYFDVTLYAQAEDPKKHFTVKEIKALTKEELLAQVKERLKTSTLFKDQALVFVHGYNTSFDNALYRTAQIAYDLDFDGAPFLYSWPSGGAVASYTYDRESAQASEPYLRQFLEMVVKETGAKQVSIIAHSMGNQPVMDVLRDMRNAAPEGVEISQVILAAPDVDADSFSNLAKTIQGLAKNVTLYVAGNDRALIVSRNFWGSYRAGDVPPAGPLILPGIDTIDVTAASTDAFAINHSGYASNNKLLADVGELLQTGLRPPEMRSLKPGKVTIGAGDYWRYVPAPQ